MQRINIGGVPEHFNLPWHLAKENHFFEKENIDLNWVTCKGGTGQMSEMLANQELDMAILLTEGSVKHIIDHQKFKIAQVFISTPLVWGIHTGYDSKIESYGEIFDQAYAISRYGIGSHLMAQVDAYFKQKSINKDQWNVIKNLEGALDSFNSNPDQVFYWEKFTTKPFVDQQKLRRVGEFITPWPCFVIVASNELIKNNPADIANVLKVINYTSHQLMEAENAIDMFIERYNMLPEDAHQWFHMTEWNTSPAVTDKMLGNVMQILKDCGVIAQKVNPIDLIAKI